MCVGAGALCVDVELWVFVDIGEDGKEDGRHSVSAHSVKEAGVGDFIKSFFPVE